MTYANFYYHTYCSAYPAFNSSISVSEHTFAVLKEEFARACGIFKLSGENTSKEWDKLFEPSDFFLKYDHYLRCNIVGPSGDANAQSWVGFAESRIRHTMRHISRGSVKTFKKIHLYPAKHSTSSGSVCYFLGLSFGDGLKGKELRLDGLDDFRFVLCFPPFIDISVSVF